MKHVVQSVAGYSLVAVVVGSGILAAVILSIIWMIQQNSASYRHTTMIEDLALARNIIVQITACHKSLAPDGTGVPVLTSGLVDLKDSSGGLVVLHTGTRFGEWTVRAWRDGMKVRVQAALLKEGKLASDKSDDDFYRDPLTHELMNWNSSRAELYPGSGLCQGELAHSEMNAVSGTLFVGASGHWQSFVNTSFVPVAVFCAPATSGTPEAMEKMRQNKQAGEIVDLACTCGNYQIMKEGVKFQGDFEFIPPTMYPPACAINYLIVGEIPH